MPPTPRVLLTIDYEPWFALTRRYDGLRDVDERKKLDANFSLDAVDPILEILSGNKISFYIVGEIAEWYSEVPQKIVAAGHELGLHCQYHRPLINVDELSQDLMLSRHWREKFGVTGYRAPMVGIHENGYELLRQHGFTYSSSIYAPAGVVTEKGGVTELPVSTMPLWKNQIEYQAPRKFSLTLLANGEIPTGSSLMIGMTPWLVLRFVETELKKGNSPVLILHPYELFPPENFMRKMGSDLLSNPLLIPFTFNKKPFLKSLLGNFPVSPLRDFLAEYRAMELHDA